MIKWFKQPKEKRATLDFDAIKTNTEPFRIEGGRYGLIIDGKFPSGTVVALGLVGMVTDKPVPVTRDIGSPSYLVLDLIAGNYLLSIGPGAIIYARLAPIG